MEVVRLERLMTREKAKLVSILAVPEAMPRSVVLSGPLER